MKWMFSFKPQPYHHPTIKHPGSLTFILVVPQVQSIRRKHNMDILCCCLVPIVPDAPLCGTCLRIRALEVFIPRLWRTSPLEREVHDQLASVERIYARGYGAEMRYGVDVPTLMGYGSESGCGTEMSQRRWAMGLRCAAELRAEIVPMLMGYGAESCCGVEGDHGANNLYPDIGPAARLP